ncbi:MAG: ATP-binding cassette domain-containing protein [Pseudomonadales bacterium]
MLTLTDIALRRGTELLLEGVSFTVPHGRKVGVIGANGTGKTSLFKLILGELEAEQGSVDYPADIRMAHLAQEVPATEDTAIRYVIGGDAPLLATMDTLADAEAKGEFGKVGELHDSLDTMDGYSANSRAEQLLVGLGFEEADFGRPLKAFSGGWRIRLNLARTLMCPSDLLLLDEPTNHLDLDAILWLSNWIKHYQGSMLLISHDREFLDETVEGIAYFNQQHIEMFTGNYSRFERLKAERLAEQQAAHEKQQREIEHMQEFVRRFRYKATKARQAQSRLKALERMELIAPAHIDSPFHFQIPKADKTSNPLLVLDRASLGYEHPVLSDVRLSLLPGDRIGLLGHNGAGKSTLVKSLRGEIPILGGHRTPGANLKIGYFSQHQVDELDLQRSAYDHIHKLDTRSTEQQIRTFLGGFDFRGDKVMDPVATFSGGEKARLALAIVAYSKPNLLLMDEPTNHLDMDMRHALTVALQDFDGAIVLISHDRHLLANTVDRFLLVDNGKVQPFDGDLDDYRARLLAPAKPKPPATEKPAKTGKPAKRRDQDHREARRLKTRIKTVEERLERLQRKLRETDEALADATLYQDGADSRDLNRLLRDQSGLQESIAQLEQEWLNKSQQLESAEGE